MINSLQVLTSSVIIPHTAPSLTDVNSCVFCLLVTPSIWQFFVTSLHPNIWDAPNVWICIDLLKMHTPCIWWSELQPMKLYAEINLATFPRCHWTSVWFCWKRVTQPPLRNYYPQRMQHGELNIGRYKELSLWFRGLVSTYGRQLPTGKQRLCVKVPLCSQESYLTSIKSHLCSLLFIQKPFQLCIFF